MTSQRLESDFGTTQNQYHLSKTPIFHQNHSKFWLILGSFGLHFRLNGLLLPHFSLLPQHDKRFVQRLPEWCVAVWQQIYENKNFQQNTSEAKGARFSKNKRRLFSNKTAFYYERAKSAYTFIYFYESFLTLLRPKDESPYDRSKVTL